MYSILCLICRACHIIAFDPTAWKNKSHPTFSRFSALFDHFWSITESNNHILKLQKLWRTARPKWPRVRKILGRAQWPALHAVLREHPRIPRAQMARATACRGLSDTHKAKSGEWWLWYILGNSRVCGQGYNLLEPFWLITRRRSVLPWWNTGQQTMSNFTIEAFESVFQTLQGYWIQHNFGTNWRYHWSIVSLTTFIRYGWFWNRAHCTPKPLVSPYQKGSITLMMGSPITSKTSTFLG